MRRFAFDLNYNGRENISTTNDLAESAVYGLNLLKEHTILNQQIEDERKTHKAEILR